MTTICGPIKSPVNYFDQEMINGFLAYREAYFEKQKEKELNQRIVSWLMEDFKKEQDIDLMQDNMAIQRLREAAEKAKIELSTVMESEINLPFITADASGPKHLVKTISRAQLENLIIDLVDKTI